MVFLSYLQFISDINGAFNAFNFCKSSCIVVCIVYLFVCVCLFVWNLLSTETIIVLFNYPHSIIIINGVYLLQGEFFPVLWQIFLEWYMMHCDNNHFYRWAEGKHEIERKKPRENDDGWMVVKRIQMKGNQL